MGATSLPCAYNIFTKIVVLDQASISSFPLIHFLLEYRSVSVSVPFAFTYCLFNVVNGYGFVATTETFGPGSQLLRHLYFCFARCTMLGNKVSQ